MTDLDKFKELFSSVGLKFTEAESTISKTGIKRFGVNLDEFTKRLSIDEGIGYSGFGADFYFDKSGKFVGHGCWE